MSYFYDPRDGHRYETIDINGLTWMAENLAYQGSDVTCYASTDPANRDPDFARRCGYLYTWGEAKKASPPGWRLPSKAEFEMLLKGKYILEKIGKIKALPAGYYFGGSYFDFGYYAYFWSATEYGSGSAYGLYLGNSAAYVGRNGMDSAFSVRCVRERS